MCKERCSTCFSHRSGFRSHLPCSKNDWNRRVQYFGCLQHGWLNHSDVLMMSVGRLECQRCDGMNGFMFLHLHRLWPCSVSQKLHVSQQLVSYMFIHTGQDSRILTLMTIGQSSFHHTFKDKQENKWCQSSVGVSAHWWPRNHSIFFWCICNYLGGKETLVC